ncbi:hypothetical protein [Vibrio furnissii]|uniref:hypothetical protein n=1 Tax=Vibrio furnissii TaxID=29494 RepID=UPI002573D8FE|nr:hypothetical protein [Vibrio furnissii]WJG21756.1 hypothetical protein QSU95_00720 [Vibrio furnissii]
MKINELMIAFQKMEKENNLFDIEYNQTLVWDTIRYNVFQALQMQYIPVKMQGLYKRVIKRTISSITQLMFLVRAMKNDDNILVCKTSRKKNEHCYIDEYSKYVLEKLSKKRVAEIELYHLAGGLANSRNLFYYSSESKLSVKFLSEILEIIKINFPSLYEEKTLTAAIQDAYSKYRSERNFYERVFKYTSIERVFLVQNGLQKGLLHAAKLHGVKVIELQHGYVGFTHPAYSYPNIASGQCTYLPKEFWIFSQFWAREINMPNTEFKIIGYDFKDFKDTTGKNVLFISRDNHHKVLVDYLKALVDKTNKKITYKLHPNQIDELAIIRNELSQYENVQVVLNEKSIEDCIKESSDIVCIQSTVVFEALQSNRKVICIKECDYIESSILEEIRNYYSIDNEEMLIHIVNEVKADKYEVKFFDEINIKLVSEL